MFNGSESSGGQNDLNGGQSAGGFSPAMQKYLSKMKEAQEDFPGSTKSWSEGSSGRHSGAAASLLNDDPSADRFVPSHKDIIKSMASKAPSDGSGHHRHSSSSSSSGGQKPPEETLEMKLSREQKAQESRRFIVSLGILCFLVGGLLITFLYSPLNDKGAERVLPPKAGMSAQPGTDSGSADENGNNGDSSDPMVIEIDKDGTNSDGTLGAKVTRRAHPAGIKVYVVGAVKNPGMVSLPFDSRVDDAIKAAGGMADNAEPLSVNLAKRIKDEDKIYVAFRDGEAPPDESGLTAGSNLVSQSGVVEPPRAGKTAEPARRNRTSEAAGNAPAAQTGSGETDAGQSKGKASAGSSEKAPFVLDMNTASEEELQKIPGIGPSISKSIIDYRSSLPGGRFTSKDQLKSVIGIGEGSYKKYEPYLEINNP